MTRRLPIALVLATACAHVSPALAQEAHVHGVSQVQIALEGESLHLAVYLPGLDTVGFEHGVVNEDQRAAVTGAVDRLRDTGRWLSFEPAEACAVVSAHVDAEAYGVNAGPASAVTPGTGGGPGAEPLRDRDHHRDHEHEHEQGAAPETAAPDPAHEDSAGEVGHGHDRHAGLTAVIEARCGQAPAALALGLAALFPSIGQIQADVITASGQDRVVLSAGQTRVPLR